MSTIEQEIISLNDAIDNLKLIENFLKKRKPSMKVFSETKKPKNFKNERRFWLTVSMYSLMISSLRLSMKMRINSLYKEWRHSLTHQAFNIWLKILFLTWIIKKSKLVDYLMDRSNSLFNQLIENPLFLEECQRKMKLIGLK